MLATVEKIQTFQFTFEAMAAKGEIVLACGSEAYAEDIAGKAISEVKRIERKYSRYLPDSVVSTINRSAGQGWLDCDEETSALLDFAGTLHTQSGGLFDITSGVLRKAWDFKQGIIPDEASIQALLRWVDWNKVERDASHIRLSEAGMEIDFGGFGKEYAADRAGEILLSSGIDYGYVNLAGDLRVVGPRPEGEPWNIGIQDPRQHGKLSATIPLSQGGLATSGDYERFFERNGKRYCHVLNPRNGQPVTYWRSISVLAPTAIVAGCCSTIAMLKEADALEFLEATGFDYLAVDHLGCFYRQGEEAKL